MSEELSREQFVYGIASDQLHEFGQWWKSMQKADPEQFPAWMDEATWYKRFAIWRSYNVHPDLSTQSELMISDNKD